MSAIFILKKQPLEETQIYHFLKDCYFVMGGSIDTYKCWCLLKDFCGLSEKCSLATLPKI